MVWVVKVRGWADTTGLGHWVFPMLDQVRIDRPVQLNLGGTADHIARHEGAEIGLVHLIAPDAPSAQAEAIHEYHERLGEVLTVPWDDLIHPADDLVSTLTELSRGANLVMLGAPSHRFHLVMDLADRIAEGVDCPALLVHIPVLAKPNALVRAVQWLIS